MDVETKWLRDFLVLTQTKNFSRAAQLKHITQPAFSRRIKALENHLDCKLINRLYQPLFSLTDNSGPIAFLSYQHNIYLGRVEIS